jgi:hypothetical protein
MVAKIVLGLGQVLSKQPDILESKELLEQVEDHTWLQAFSFNAGWMVPVCQVDYMQTFLLNTFLLPAFLMALVAMTWTTNSKKAGKDNDEDNEEDTDEATIAKRSDFYVSTQAIILGPIKRRNDLDRSSAGMLF